MTTIQIRTDEQIKKNAQHVLEALGMDLSTAINVYLRQIIKHGGIPFALKTENGMTPAEEQKILEELRSAKKSRKKYSSARELHRAMLGK